MATEEKRSMSSIEFMRKLTEAGIVNFLLIDLATAKAVLTDRRMELLETIRDEEVESVTDLAETLGRDKAAVSRDLDLLFEQDMIVYEREGSRKIPKLKHETVVVEPLL
jgi:predicted transcriptional regulator